MPAEPSRGRPGEGGPAQARDARDAPGRIKGLDYLAASRPRTVRGSPGAARRTRSRWPAWPGRPSSPTGTRPRGASTPRASRGPSSSSSGAPRPTGLITGPGQDSGQPMHGHGFALLFLASAYGMITKASLRQPGRRRGPQGRHPDQPGAEQRGGLDLYPRDRRRRVGHRHAGAGPAGRAQRRVPRPAGGDRLGRGLPREVPDARGGDPVLASVRRRPSSADLGGGSGHAVQRRPVRQPDRHRLPQVRLGPVPRQRPVEQGRRPRLLHPPVCVAGLLHGGRRPTGTPTSRRPATSSSPCRAATGRGTATGSARSTAPRSP